jgi:hypothetical protein
MTSVALAGERIYLGMDVSRDMIAVAVLRPGEDVPAVEVISSDGEMVRRLIGKFADRSPARPAAHCGRWRPGRMGARCAGAGWWRRVPLPASYARGRIAGRCSAGRDPAVTSGVGQPRESAGIGPAATCVPAHRSACGGDGQRVSWSSWPTRTRRARGRPRSPRGSSRRVSLA